MHDISVGSGVAGRPCDCGGALWGTHALYTQDDQGHRRYRRTLECEQCGWFRLDSLVSPPHYTDLDDFPYKRLATVTVVEVSEDVANLTVST